ncbi:MAG: alpha/beta hydrolase family protein, partial [Candidatus Helarchaeales archaeon]
MSSKSRGLLLFIFKKVFLVTGITLFIISFIMSLSFNVVLAPSTEYHFQIEADEPFAIWGRNGTMIDVVIYYPKDPPYTLVSYQKKPVVVLCHGFSCDKTYMKGAAYELNRRGFVVVSLTARGHGASGAQFIGMTYFENETLAVVQWIRNQADALNIDVDKIGLAGHSMGACTVTSAAIKDQELGNYWINATVSIAGPRFNTTRGDPDPTYRTTTNRWSFMNSPLGSRFFYPFSTLQGINFEKAVEESVIEGRVNDSRPYNYLNIIGEWDEAFSVQSAQEVVWNMGQAAVFGLSDFTALPSGQLFGSFKNGTARMLTVVPRLDHLMEMHDPTVLSTMINWFEESMGLKSESGLPDSTPQSIIEPLRWSSNLLVLLAIGLLFIPLTVYLGNSLRSLHAPAPKAAKDIPKKETYKLFAIYAGIYMGLAVPVFPIVAAFNLQFLFETDFLYSNLISVFGFMHVLLLIP